MKRRRKSRILALGEEQVVLSEERTLLSHERTILSFMQTAIAFIGIGLVVLNVFQEFNIKMIGLGLIIIGAVEIIESLRRIIKYKKDMESVKKRETKIKKMTGI